MTGRRIVVGVDGSSGANSALDWARNEVLRYGGELVDLEAVDRPAERLVEASRTADLVVVGTRGQGSATGAVFGSVSRRVAAQAHCPVVVVPEGRPGGTGVVVGGTSSPAGLLAVEAAFREAQLRGEPLTVYHVRGGGHAVARLAERLTLLQRAHPEVDVHDRIVTGEPADALVAAARGAAILVLGSHHSDDRWSTRLGPVPAEVLPVAPCPVMVVGQAHLLPVLTG